MPSRRDSLPLEMCRTAVTAPEKRWRRVLVELADLGCFEPDPALDGGPNPVRALADSRPAEAAGTPPELSPAAVEVEQLAVQGEWALLLGEAELVDRTGASLPAGTCRVLPGWVSRRDAARVREVLAAFGGALVDLPGRPGAVPPTAHGAAAASLRPLVSTYATVPYRDIDPTVFAAAAYMLMFGMMFGDVAHGAAILLVGLLARTGRGRIGRLRSGATFLIGAGVSATAFGFLYGEAFGPTGVVPALWLHPMEEPGRLLAAGIVVGAVLLALTFALAIVDRWREGGATLALYDPSGVPGAALLAAVGSGVLAAGGRPGLWPLTWVLAGIGVLLVFTGLVVRAGGRSGSAEAVVELFDTLLRLGSNLVSFARLAAFGLTHAVLTAVVWDGTAALWRTGGPLLPAAVALFAVGNLAAFALGALVGAVQALRLEYYELFSRLFTTYGRPFTPWRVPARRTETP